MQTKLLHSWDVTTAEALLLQKELAKKVVVHHHLIGPIQSVAGVDVSYRRHGHDFHAAVVVLDLKTMALLEAQTASGKVRFPYVPGLLSFRELPFVLSAFNKLASRPDVVCVDGQGIAHPRRFGLASHLGLWLDLPTIGCAKSRLCGQHDPPGEARGAWTPLYDRDEVIGRVVRTRDCVKPVYVSPGHKIGFAKAMEIVLQCGRGFRLPEPTRQAHLLSNQARANYENRFKK